MPDRSVKSERQRRGERGSGCWSPELSDGEHMCWKSCHTSGCGSVDFGHEVFLKEQDFLESPEGELVEEEEVFSQLFLCLISLLIRYQSVGKSVNTPALCFP